MSRFRAVPLIGREFEELPVTPVRPKPPVEQGNMSVPEGFIPRVDERAGRMQTALQGIPSGSRASTYGRYTAEQDALAAARHAASLADADRAIAANKARMLQLDPTNAVPRNAAARAEMAAGGPLSEDAYGRVLVGGLDAPDNRARVSGWGMGNLSQNRQDILRSQDRVYWGPEQRAETSVPAMPLTQRPNAEIYRQQLVEANRPGGAAVGVPMLGQQRRDYIPMGADTAGVPAPAASRPSTIPSERQQRLAEERQARTQAADQAQLAARDNARWQRMSPEARARETSREGIARGERAAEQRVGLAREGMASQERIAQTQADAQDLRMRREAELAARQGAEAARQFKARQMTAFRSKDIPPDAQQIAEFERSLDAMLGTAPVGGQGQSPMDYPSVSPAATQRLKANPSSEMKKYFDDIFGPGASDRALAGN